MIRIWEYLDRPLSHLAPVYWQTLAWYLLMLKVGGVQVDLTRAGHHSYLVIPSPCVTLAQSCQSLSCSALLPY